MFKWLSPLAREGRRGFLKRPRLAKTWSFGSCN
nr:MAG TPA: hypothetical protein [Caudoviricetes sp.]